MLFKLLVIAFLLSIFANLGVGLYHLVRCKKGSNGVVVSLSWRIGLSCALFSGLIIAYALGWAAPHPI